MGRPAPSPKTVEIGLGCANVLRSSLPELIELAARHGFRSISARPYAFKQALSEGFTAQSLRKLLSDAGLGVSMVDGFNRDLPGLPPPGVLDDAMRAVAPPDVLDPPDEETCFRTAEALGTNVVNVIHYRGAPDVPRQQLVDAIGAICHRAAKRGLRIALEFVPGNGMPDLATAKAIVAATGAANCGYCMDFFHHDRTGGTVADIAKLAPGSIFNIQLSDRIRTPVAAKPFGGRELPGKGELPLKDLLAASLAISPDCYVDIEVLNEELRNLSADGATGRLAAAARAWQTSL